MKSNNYVNVELVYKQLDQNFQESLYMKETEYIDTERFVHNNHSSHDVLCLWYFSISIWCKNHDLAFFLSHPMLFLDRCISAVNIQLYWANIICDIKSVKQYSIYIYICKYILIWTYKKQQPLFLYVFTFA